MIVFELIFFKNYVFTIKLITLKQFISSQTTQNNENQIE